MSDVIFGRDSGRHTSDCILGHVYVYIMGHCYLRLGTSVGLYCARVRCRLAYIELWLNKILGHRQPDSLIDSFEQPCELTADSSALTGSDPSHWISRLLFLLMSGCAAVYRSVNHTD